MDRNPVAVEPQRFVKQRPPCANASAEEIPVNDDIDAATERPAVAPGRAVIREAAEVLAERRQINRTSAYEILVQASVDENRKLRDVARQVLQDAGRPSRIE